ncbi:TniQ family protein [Paracidovorax anthurii]|uniref:TniQ protein n=1 Tax=Paracidovorax anthurii TaxID=78229 RepID=A0A328YSJ0_9BURK|nr:TniQ family protein [Paracidovorax anthurii]RAR76981.1 TniQ protein [Paracidovorax anthurii]
MSMLQLPLDCAQQPLPFQDEIWPGESGQGYVLRLAARNGLGGLARVKSMLGCSRFQTLYAQDAPQLAHWFGASVQRLAYALEAADGDKRVEGATYSGHKLGRSYFLNRSHPRVCPNCVHEFGYGRAAWDFTLTVACVRHQRLLIDRCPACTVPLKWTRPDLCLCDCGYPWPTLDYRFAATDAELFVAQLIDLRMDDQERFARGESAWILPSRNEMNALGQFMKDLSLDGVFRTLFAFATAAGYQADAPLERRLRSAMPKAQQTIAMSIAVGTKLTQQKRFSLKSSPSVLLDLLREVSVECPATAIDMSVAKSLFGVFQSGKPARSQKQVWQSQLVLF